MSIEDINVTAPTSLLIRDSPYWTSRVTEHAVQHEASSSTPIVLDLDNSDCGLYVTAYEFLVYVGLLQAENHMQRALWANQANQNPLFEGIGSFFESFAAFAPAGLPAPSPRTLSNVSRMAAFFGRNNLIMQVPDSIVDHPSSPPVQRSQNDFIYAGTLQQFPGDSIAHSQDDVNTPTYYHHLGNDTVEQSRSLSPQQSPMPPLSATETEMETETGTALTYLPDGHVVLPPMHSLLSPSFYGSSPEAQSHPNNLHETDMYDRSSRSQRSSRLPERFHGERAAERRHHPYRRSSRCRLNSSRGTQTME